MLSVDQRRRFYAFSLVFVGFFLITGIECQLSYSHHSGLSISDTLSGVMLLGLNQFENLLVAVLLGLLGTWCSSKSAWRRLYLLIAFVCFAILIINERGYSILFEHLQLSMVELGGDEIIVLFKTVAQELSWVFWLNIVLLAVAMAVIWYVSYNAPGKSFTRMLTVVMGAFALVCFVGFGASAAGVVSAPESKTQRNPLVMLLFSAYLSTETPDQRLVDESINIYAPRYGTFAETSEQAVELASAFDAIRAAYPRPNVLFIILESVGSLQLVPEGRFDPDATPVLASLAEHSVLFTSLYNTFPATTIAHLSLVTGGRTITWGSVFEELTYPYVGPTIPGQFKDNGYWTALVSAQFANFENLDQFYIKLGKFDDILLPERLPKEFSKKHRINHWTVDEGTVGEYAKKWLRKYSGADKPIYLQFLTGGTHYPYTVPKGYRGPRSGDTREDHYYNAVHYSDMVIGQLIDVLREQGSLDHTLIFVTGDHGQAFGKRHKRNFLHKNFLYEENIKNFFMVIAPRALTKQITSDRIGTLGDEFATMSSLAGLGVPNIPGRDLFGTDFRNRLVYFHKIALPRLWGLRDGQWKFLGQIQSEEESELYNLVDDPLESKNLAQQYPARVVNYRRLAATWFYRANVDFMNQLAGFAQGNDVRPDSLKDFHQPGPKAIAFGVKNADGQFRARATIRPQDRVTVWVRWVEYGVKKKVRFKWLSPDGRVADVYDMELEPDWTTTRVTYGGRRPLVAGKWHLDVWDGETKLIGGSFEVVR